jgi:nitrate/nitrite transport system ATP-binding protein
MMTSGPYAKVGDVAQIKLERPRERKSVVEHPDFYKYRQHLLTFLDH